MLRQDGSIVLIDFGLARGIENEARTTAAGVLRGSPYYMSPEQAQGLPPDARSDLYSLGVMLFEMLSGAKPYSGSSAVEVIQQHVRGARPALPKECQALEPVLEGLMARELSERFPDALTAQRALQQAASNLAATLEGSVAALDIAVGLS
jgi:serine/threonine protein kinase